MRLVVAPPVEPELAAVVVVELVAAAADGAAPAAGLVAVVAVVAAAAAAAAAAAVVALGLAGPAGRLQPFADSVSAVDSSALAGQALHHGLQHSSLEAAVEDRC